MLEKTPLRESMFWAHVTKHQGEDACWEWNAYITTSGYGALGTTDSGHREKFYAHKVSFEWYVGILKPGQMVRHTCDNRPCIRPKHLIPGTHQDNMDDMVERKRHVGNREIDAETAIRIRVRRAAGESAKLLGAEYGLTPQHVSNICTGVYWPDAGGPLTRRFEIDDKMILDVLMDLPTMTQSACAAKHGISKAAVQQIAAGKRKPRNTT